MEEIKFRNLRADEIEVRRGRPVGDRVELLIYKDARVDANILDETVGQFGWCRKHNELKGNLFCSVGIYSEEHNAFIFKEDAGAPSNFEAQKGEASDAFKRACFAWGIGRSLYTAPRIVVKPKNQYTQFYVDNIGYDEKNRICDLRIVDEDGTVIFDYKDGKEIKVQPRESVDNIEVLRTVCGELKRDESVDRKELLKFYKYYETRIKDFNNVSDRIVFRLWNKWLERA